MSGVLVKITEEQSEQMKQCIAELVQVAAKYDLPFALVSFSVLGAALNVHAIGRGITPADHNEFMTFLHNSITEELSEQFTEYIRSSN